MLIIKKKTLHILLKAKVLGVRAPYLFRIIIFVIKLIYTLSKLFNDFSKIDLVKSYFF